MLKQIPLYDLKEVTEMTSFLKKKKTGLKNRINEKKLARIRRKGLNRK